MAEVIFADCAKNAVEDWQSKKIIPDGRDGSGLCVSDADGNTFSSKPGSLRMMFMVIPLSGKTDQIYKNP